VTPSLAPGTELDGGKYRVRRPLGHGGVGAVFEAENTRTNKRVAIKCIQPAQCSDPESAERLLREAQATSRIRHPNVVDVYDVGREADLVFLVMEYLEGEPLSYVLARRTLPMHRLIALLLPAMRGVAEAHRQGVVHRDIKPENIFLAKQADTPELVPKVLDFGISKLESRGSDLRALTQAGHAIGTPRYMSYEQLTGAETIDGRTDIYAFGVILYEALTGRVPYDADTFSELLVKLSVQPITPPLDLSKDVPKPLSNIVMWALERERAERISSMAALIRELEPFATARGFLADLTVQVASSEPSGSPAPVAALTPCAAAPGGALAAETKLGVDVRARPAREPTRNTVLRIAAVVVTLVIILGAWLANRAAPRPRSSAPPAPVFVPKRSAAPPPLPAARTGAETVERKLAEAPIPTGVAPPAAPSPARSLSPRPKTTQAAPRDFGIY
jgi:eukaryotic-like serine/threonine-protein kinase